MSDLAIIVASAKMTLHEISKQSGALATGLQNASPSDRADTPNNSIQYLFAVAENLEKTAEECAKILSTLDRYQ